MRLITRVRNRFGDGNPRQPTCDSRVSQTSRVFSGDQSWDGEDIVMMMGNRLGHLLCIDVTKKFRGLWNSRTAEAKLAVVIIN